MSKHSFSLLIFLLLLTFSHSTFPFRQLQIDKKTKDKVCKANNKNYNPPKKFESLTTFVDGLQLENQGQDFIKNVLLKGKTDGLFDFVKQLIIYLFFIYSFFTVTRLHSYNSKETYCLYDF